MPIDASGAILPRNDKYDNPRSPNALAEPGKPMFEGEWQVGRPSTLQENVPIPQLAFPNSLKNSAINDPFIHINVVDPVKRNKRTCFAVGLQMPTSLRVAYNAEWKEVSLGAIGKEAELMSAAMANHGGWNAAYEATPGLAKQLIAKGGFNLAQYLGGNIGSGTQIGARFMVNPHAALQFEGMHFREFKLDFVLFPKSVQDSVELDEIIFQLKYAMHPEGFGQNGNAGALSQFWGYPQNFKIGFYGPNYKWLFRTSACVLVGCEVEYNGCGLPAFFANTSDPVCVQLSLHFKETELLTKASIQEGR